jgi:RHS repeat-associated protein
MTDGSGRVLFYGYDHGGRLISVADEAGEIVGYRHTPGGKVKEIRHRNGVRTAYEYDTEGNIIRLLTETRDGGTICDLRYEYDLNGNRTAKSGTMLLPGHPGGVSEQIRDIHYRYDRMDRLTAEVRDGEETSYIYDVCGNRLEKRKGGRTERYCYNGKNQLVRRVAGGDAWDYTYDLQGNLVREVGPKGERQYLYDTENRQIRVLSGGKEIQEARYDGKGMRAGLTVNGKKSTFLYADQRLYAEFDETGVDISRYIWGDGLVGLGYQGELHGLHQDEQLNTGWITGEEGVPENTYEYDAFGVILGSHGKVQGRLLYGGQQYDAEVKQYYLRARYYNPVIGRFMQEDTYRGDGLNLYAYCANNPVMYYDPSGRNGCKKFPNAKENVQQENVTGQRATGVVGYLSEPALEDGVLSIGAGKKPIEGAYNIDTNPTVEGVYMGDATDLSGIASGSQKTIIIENPYGYDPLNPEILRVLEANGTIEITGARSNKYVNKTPKRASQLGFTVTEEIVHNIGQFTTTDGTVISPERTQSFVKYILKSTDKEFFV